MAKPDEWRDNCDSYYCPECGYETNNPEREEFRGVWCPRCHRQLRWDLPGRGQEKRLYTANEVAVILAELFGDTCACNFNGIDEWLPYKCELTDCCPNTYGVACWEQYLKYRNTKGGAEDGQ